MNLFLEYYLDRHSLNIGIDSSDNISKKVDRWGNATLTDVNALFVKKTRLERYFKYYSFR